jgi:hypothetical protein
MLFARRRTSGGTALAAIGAALLLSGCFVFPAPTPPQPLTKTEVGALAKCQKAITKAELAYVKTRLGTLGACLQGILGVRLPFESALTTQEELDAGIAKMRTKCTKGYAKVTAASTKLVDAILKACAPVEEQILGAYDGLRFQAAHDQFGDPPASLEALAATICALTTVTSDAQLWHAAPRELELLGYLGPEFTVFFDMSSGFPNVPLDPRCPPITGSMIMLVR